MPLDWILLRSRWALLVKFMFIVFRSRRKALQENYDDSAWADSSYDCLYLMEKVGGKFSVAGLDHIRNLDGPVVFIGNHMSTLETLILPVLIAPLRRVTFVVKEKLVKGPVFGPVMRSRKPITVGRTDPRKDLEAVLTEGEKKLSEGSSIIIFPQSTRKVNFNPRHFNSLGVKLARNSGVKVVPIALKTDFWENGKILSGFGKIRRKRTIHFEFGAPLSIKGQGKNEHKQVVKFITSRLAKWGSTIQDGAQ
ncbi:MAG: 1-acyl-sn-glycerol-3-phosphate acyltransferase [Spirochaetales bacterium]|nr:1-acyl-sn-glycerol-3-phosphate acyltransferase [Spirochaetales bacterium]